MKLKELELLTRQGESDTLEFKKSTALLDSAAQTLCGFLNGKGGSVLIGVAADKKLVGQHVTDNTLQEIARALAKFEPYAQIDIERIDIEQGKEVVVLKAPFRKSDIPYSWDGRPYQRIASTTSRMSQQVYEKLLLERDQNNQRWETGIAVGYHESDLDAEEILRTVRLGAANRRLPEYQGDGIGSILDRLELRKDGRILNAAVVLFGKKFKIDFPQCELRLARFIGIDKSEFLDQSQLTGNAFYLFEEAMVFLRRHLPVAARIEPNIPERQETPLFPFDALREALVNALCHRVYSNPGGAISMAIFDDRLEIWNDGKLPFGLTPENLKEDHISCPRNLLIANVFYSRGLIEKWGRGTQKIVQLCIKAGLPEPEFIEQANSFAIRFMPSNYVAPRRVSHDLSDRQRLVLQLLSTGREFALPEVKSNVPNPPADRTLRDDFQHLKRLGLITVTGRGPRAKWSLVLQIKAE